MSRICRLFLPCLLGLVVGLLMTSCTSPQPSKKGLVDVRRMVPNVVVDLRYGTTDNVTGKALYPPDMPCLLRASTAQKLKKAQRRLRSQGYGLKIWDAWRPTEVHQRLYRQGAGTGMFLDPNRGWSRHCGGISVDATLVDKHSQELPMPTHFDEDLHRASSHEQPKDPTIRRHLSVLHEAMTAAGFKALPGEWWHFDDVDFLYRPIPVIKAADIGVKLSLP